MSQSCRRGGCPRRRPSELDALVAESGCSVTEISAPAERIMQDVADFEGMVSVTSNAVAVVTQIGRAPALSHVGTAFRLPDRGALLRVDPAAVGSTLAVDRPPYGRSPCSVQFFAREGTTLHKLFLASMTDDYAFAEMTQDWVGAFDAPERGEPHTPADPLFWRCRDLRFHLDSLFGDAGLRRRASLPGWGEDHAWRIDPELAVHLLGLITEIRAPATTVVPNAGFAQLRAGPFDSMRRAGDALRLSGADCSLSLDMAEVEEAWVTTYESDGRPGLSVEFYDWGYQCVAQVTAADDDERLWRFWNRTVQQIPKLR